jgi:hypothetical protein
VVALGISALGKKRHRVEIARRLVVGSLVASFENQKDIFYQAGDTKGNALFRVLDSSQPWWTEKDTWGRWRKISTTDSAVSSSFAPATCLLNKESFGACLVSSNGHVNSSTSHLPIPLAQVIDDLAAKVTKQSQQSQVRTLAM